MYLTICFYSTYNMYTHLALLRGINVSGHHIIKMDALQKALESIGFNRVRTYIQSGNVFVDCLEADSNAVAFDIKQQIFKVFGFDVPVLVISKNDLLACLKNNSFLVQPNMDTKKLYVAFVSKLLSPQSIHELKMSNIKPDEVVIDESRIYIKYEVSPAKTKLDQKYIEKKLNVVATIRNWNTVNKLLEMYE